MLEVKIDESACRARIWVLTPEWVWGTYTVRPRKRGPANLIWRGACGAQEGSHLRMQLQVSPRMTCMQVHASALAPQHSRETSETAHQA